MAVRIRMKKMGRKHRPFYRICAMEIRAPRDGRVLEQLGTYDPLIPETDARAILNKERIKYWLGVGATPSDKVSVLIKKYGEDGTHLAQQQAALDRLAQQRRRPEPAQPMPTTPKPKKSETDAPSARRSDAEDIRAQAAAAEEKE
ncbi:MAG: 30S ribosomal protein S16 [Thermoguttaceae bacterium]